MKTTYRNVRVKTSTLDLVSCNELYTIAGDKISETRTIDYYIRQGIAAGSKDKCDDGSFVGAAGRTSSAEV